MYRLCFLFCFGCSCFFFGRRGEGGAYFFFKTLFLLLLLYFFFPSSSSFSFSSFYYGKPSNCSKNSMQAGKRRGCLGERKESVLKAGAHPALDTVFECIRRVFGEGAGKNSIPDVDSGRKRECQKVSAQVC